MKFFVVFALLFAAAVVAQEIDPQSAVTDPLADVSSVAQESDPSSAVTGVLDGSSGGSSVTQQNNLLPADIAQIQAILSKTVGPYAANNIVKIVAALSNGVLRRIPLSKLLRTVTGLVTKLLQPTGAVGQLVGQQGLGNPVGQLLGAN